MQVGVMITNGGPHSAEKWAAMTASQIIQVAATATGQQAIDGRRLELEILDILIHHHDKVQTHERIALTKLGHDRLTHDYKHTHSADPFAAIIKATKGTLFEDYFSQPEIQTYIHNVLDQHFASNMHVERSWHVDKHPDHPHSKSFKARHHG